MAQKLRKIDITPTWEGIMPVLISILEKGSPEGKKEVKVELMRLAKQIDSINKMKLKRVV